MNKETKKISAMKYSKYKDNIPSKYHRCSLLYPLSRDRWDILSKDSQLQRMNIKQDWYRLKKTMMFFTQNI